MGDALAELLHYECPECGTARARMPQATAMELACWLYALGKIARLITDYKHGKSGKADTWFDDVIYGQMARRIQETGQWP